MDITYKQLWESIQTTLNLRSVYFEISAIAFLNEALSVKLVRTDPADVEKAIKDTIEALDVKVLLVIREKTSGTISFVVRETLLNKEPEGIPFSSDDEFKGAEPVEIAIDLVRKKAMELNIEWLQEHHGQFTVYPVWFAYTLGNWKAMLSTSIPDGRYYEVTDNKEKGETYVDVYAKTSNTVHKHN